MGLIADILAALFGPARNAIRDSVGAFRPNAEADAARDAARAAAALAQFSGEFGATRRGLFDRVMDGLNRLPRPALALGTLGLFVAAMVDPIWFAARMQGIALVPEPLWWLMGAIVSFYFGARYQTKSQEFQASLAAIVARSGQVAANLRTLRAMARDPGDDLAETQDNPALDDWRARR